MRIEQNLHGYADGHRLLAGSVDLPRQAKYLMLGLSDMSGRSMVPGFEEYLTGYPLPGVGYYAFARTWYAPEMERPGCVWTHTLLVEARNLGSVIDLAGLRQMFRRPSKGDGSGWEAYRQPLEYLERGIDVSAVPHTLEQQVNSAVWGLYGIPDLPLLHPAEDAHQLEDMVMALWSQQWPSLRFAFRFCSGAIGVRASGTQPFDFQVIPITSIREVRREVPASSVVASGGWPTPPEFPEWLTWASADLRAGAGLSYRQFLREHAGVGLDGRGAFAPLGELFSVWEEASQRKTPACLLEAIGRHHPETSAAGRLKQAVAGRGFPLAKSLLPDISECDVLLAIATSVVESAFDPERLEFEERAHGLWEKERARAEALVSSLIAADLNRTGERILLALIRGMSIEDAIRHSDAIPGLVATVVRMDPEVATSPAVWQGQPDHQRGLFDAATGGGDVAADLQRSIVLAMLQAGSDAAAERAVRKFGAATVFVVLTWFDESGNQSPRDLLEGWRQALSLQTPSLVAWLADRQAVREASGALIADLSNPHSPEVRRHGADVWLKTIASPDSMTPADARIRLHTFLLAFAFDAPPGRPDELVARTFHSVHAALAEGQLADDSWAWIDDHLPKLSIWRNWDRCERLRRGLAERFVTNEWHVAQFVRCAHNCDALRDLLKACKKVDGGNRLLKRIRNAIADDEVPLDQQSREVVNGYF